MPRAPRRPAAVPRTNVPYTTTSATDGRRDDAAAVCGSKLDQAVSKVIARSKKANAALDARHEAFQEVFGRVDLKSEISSRYGTSTSVCGEDGLSRGQRKRRLTVERLRRKHELLARHKELLEEKSGGGSADLEKIRRGLTSKNHPSSEVHSMPDEEFEEPTPVRQSSKQPKRKASRAKLAEEEAAAFAKKLRSPGWEENCWNAIDEHFKKTLSAE